MVARWVGYGPGRNRVHASYVYISWHWEEIRQIQVVIQPPSRHPYMGSLFKPATTEQIQVVETAGKSSVDMSCLVHGTLTDSSWLIEGIVLRSPVALPASHFRGDGLSSPSTLLPPSPQLIRK